MDFLKNNEKWGWLEFTSGLESMSDPTHSKEP